MKFHDDKQELNIKLNNEVYKKAFLVLFLVACSCFLFISRQSIAKSFGVILGIVYPFLVGGALAFLLKIPLNLIEKNIFNKIHNKYFQKIKRPLALVLSLVIIIAIIAILLTLILPQFISSLMELQKKLPQFVQEVLDRAKEIDAIKIYAENAQEKYDQLSWNTIYDQVESFLKSDKAKNTTIISTAFTTAQSIVSGMMTGVIAFITSLYILGDKERLEYQGKRILYSIMPLPVADKVKHVFHLLHENFFGFIRGQVLDSFFLGVVIFIGCTLMKMPNAAMLGVIVGVTNLVPIIGPFIGGIIGFILIVIEDPTKAIIFAIFILIMQQIEGNIVYPRVVGGTLGLPPLWTLIAIALGGSLFGVVGMWLFIPLASTAYALIAEYTQYRINDKGIDMRQV